MASQKFRTTLTVVHPRRALRQPTSEQPGHRLKHTQCIQAVITQPFDKAGLRSGISAPSFASNSFGKTQAGKPGGGQTTAAHENPKGCQHLTKLMGGREFFRVGSSQVPVVLGFSGLGQ